MLDDDSGLAIQQWNTDLKNDAHLLSVFIPFPSRSKEKKEQQGQCRCSIQCPQVSSKFYRLWKNIMNYEKSHLQSTSTIKAINQGSGELGLPFTFYDKECDSTFCLALQSIILWVRILLGTTGTCTPRHTRICKIAKKK